jgi:aspartokinase
MYNEAVTDIAVTYNVALVTVDNLPNNMKLISDIFNAIAGEGIVIDMISQAPPYHGSINLSFSLSSDNLVKAITALNEFKKKIPGLAVEVDATNTKLTVCGARMKNLPGVAAKLFTLLAEKGIEIKLVTTSETDISYLIFDRDVDAAIEAIKSEYGLK